MARVPVVGFTYAQVEAALRALFGVPACAEGSFRGRVRHLQRIGLFGIATGKGRRISYTVVQTNEWMLALLLAQFGVDPIVIVKSVTRERKKLQEWIVEATDDDALGGDEVFLESRPQLMSSAWFSRSAAGILRFEKFRRHDWPLKIPRHLHPRPSGRSALNPAGLSSTSPPSTQPARRPHRLDAENFIGGFPVFGTPELTEIRRLDPSLLVINLTGPVRAVGEALRAAASSLTEAEQVPPGLAFRAKRGAKESP
jgi:hypothetical protein